MTSFFVCHIFVTTIVFILYWVHILKKIVDLVIFSRKKCDWQMFSEIFFFRKDVCLEYFLWSAKCEITRTRFYEVEVSTSVVFLNRKQQKIEKGRLSCLLSFFVKKADGPDANFCDLLIVKKISEENKISSARFLNRKQNKKNSKSRKKEVYLIRFFKKKCSLRSVFLWSVIR